MATIPSVSIVIPVYNEMALLERCLTAISQQTVQPFEVIVVDNNSSDSSVMVAASYRNVHVIHEKRQGVAYARSRGFDAARGDIIGRIDADTQLAPNWVAQVGAAFAADPQLDAISGVSGPSELSPTGHQWFTWLQRFFRWYQEHNLGVRPMLYGHNMALRRSTWRAIRRAVQVDEKRYHEDLAIAAYLQHHGTVRFEPRLRATIPFGRSLRLSKMKYYAAKDKATVQKYSI